MNLITFIFFSITLFLISTYVRSNDQKALIFAGIPYRFAEKKQLMNKTYGLYVYACPAESDEEKKYNADDSITKRSLFVKKTYNSFTDLEDENICAEAFKPSVIRYKYENEVEYTQYEIGYEVNYEIKNFARLKSSEIPLHLQRVSSEMAEIIRKKQNGENGTYGFIWLEILSIQFDVNKLIPKIVRYTMDRDATKTDECCENFDLGNQFEELANVNSFYDHNNQRNMLADVDQVISDDNLLQKHQVVPPRYFHNHASVFATCSILNTMPIWGSIAGGWLKEVEDYLYALSQVIKSYNGIVNILSGTSGVLSLQTKDQNSKEMYLDHENNRISLPNIVYKIVEYEIAGVGATGVLRKMPKYAIIIVTHNDPFATAIEPICEEEKELGWADIINKQIPTGFTYWCSPNEEVFNTLSYTYDHSLTVALNLQSVHFPTLTKDQPFEKKNIREKVKEYLKEMRKESISISQTVDSESEILTK